MFILPESIPVVQEVLVLRFLAVLATAVAAEVIQATQVGRAQAVAAAVPLWFY